MRRVTRVPALFGWPKAVRDPYWSNVVLMLHFEGPNASTTITDSSLNPKTVAASGNFKLTTSSSIAGAASAEIALSGSYGGGYATVSSDADLALGTSDFTVEGSFKWPGGNGGNLFTFASNNWNVGLVSSQLVFWDGAANRIVGSGMTSGAVHHIALTRAGTAVRLFKDGVQIGSTWTDSAPTNLGQQSMRIGSYPASGTPSGSEFHGLIDELRITKGIARYTSNFAVPTVPLLDR